MTKKKVQELATGGDTNLPVGVTPQQMDAFVQKSTPPSFDVSARDKRMLEQLGHVKKTMKMEAARALTAEYAPTPCHPTNIPKLDRALNGGLPKGRIIELFGNEGGGKTTLSLCVGKSAQQVGGIVHYTDAENKFDESIVHILGLDRSAFQLVVPDSQEMVWNELYNWLDKAGPEDVAIVDSIAMMRPMEEMQTGEKSYGTRASMNALGIDRCKPKIQSSRCTVIIINQLRKLMGVVYGNPETTPGGDALKYAAATRLRVVSRGSVKDDDDRVIGQLCKIKAVKCNHARPHIPIDVPLIYGKGFVNDPNLELFEDALNLGIIIHKEKSPSYSYGNHSIKGRQKFIDEIGTNEELRNWLLEAVARQKESAGVTHDDGE